MTNSVAQVVGLVLMVASAMLSFALIPQPDFIIDPLVKFVLGIASVGITTAALYLNVRMPGQTGTG